jgi:hypothetical protein
VPPVAQGAGYDSGDESLPHMYIRYAMPLWSLDLSSAVFRVCATATPHDEPRTAVEEAEVGADEAHVMVLRQPRHLV